MNKVEVISPEELALMKAASLRALQEREENAFRANLAKTQKMRDDAERRVARVEEAKQMEELRLSVTAKHGAAIVRWDKAAKRIPEAAALLKEQIRDEIRNKRDASKKKYDATLRALKREQAQRIQQVEADERAMLASEKATYAATIPGGVPKVRRMSKMDALLVMRTQAENPYEPALTK
jgi:hypothetical protein